MKKFVTFLFLCMILNVSAQITVNILESNIFFNYMGVNSFNPEEPDSQPNFMNVVIALEDHSTPYTGSYKIFVRIDWGDAYAEVYMIPVDPLFPTAGWNLTNRDLINNDPPNFYMSGNYDDFVDEIEDILLSTGKMPDGNYLLTVEVQNAEGDPISNSDMVTITIQSPLAIDLLTPGAPFGLSLVQIGTQYPEFLWISNFDEYNLYVYELDENITSPEDIELLEPYFETLVYSNIFGYPPGAANSLNPGSTYAWQITAETFTPITNQNVTMKSSFYVFHVMQGGSFPPIDPVVLQNLINQFLTTGSGVQELLGLLQNGYSVQTIWWQGQEITLEELMAILNSGQYTPSE
ncbi:MAG: hypothetical protein Q7J16_05040 [Candidatus Cloacimonadales bacterium]|nr:hypothetical protein [Candidatus Cloacimonadales bacterium]